MVYEVQTATNENLCGTFLVSQSGTHKTQAPGFHPVQELHYFIFMKLRPLVFILCKHFTISFSWNSGPRFSSCARMPHLIFMNLSLMFSACARMSPFNFHESQSHVFSPCMHFTGHMPKLLEQACGSLCCKIVYGVLVEGLLNFMSGEGGSHIFLVS